MNRTLYILIVLAFFYACNSESEKKDPITKIKREKLITPVSEKENQRDSVPNTSIEKDRCLDRKDIDVPLEIRQSLGKLYPNYRIAKNSDFFDNYWCYFYKESDSPYFITGDFDGDGNNEFALMLTKNERTKTIIVVLDKIRGQFQSMVVDSLVAQRKPNIDIKYTKFYSGLHKHKPETIKTMATDSTYIFSNEFISLDFFEKGGYYYLWTGKEFKRIGVGC
ncbi:MAG: hypothetical protein FVQ77_01915 [Cytophagales bacterium]|nr:hypothetical protein [Cytophagales bacterium]